MMRLHRFFIGQSANGVEQKIPSSGEVTISDVELAHQLRRVFRFISGDKVILFDGSGYDFICEITSFEKESVKFVVQEKIQNKNVPQCEVFLFASLIKNSNYELVLEKCTELGVSHFVPIISERSEKKKLNYDRARKIIKEASEQSGRGTLPKIYDTILLLEVFEQYKVPFFVFHGSGENFRQSNDKFQISPETFAEAKVKGQANVKENKIGILIGPEGGWSENEIKFFKEKNIPIYSLGNQILRAETASIVASAFLLL